MATKLKAKSDESLVTFSPNGIVCFPHVWEPYKFRPEQEAKFSLILVFQKGTDLTDMKRTAGRAIVKKWKEDGKKLLARGKLALPWRDAEDYDKYGEPFVKGNIMINFKSNSAPQLVDARAKPIMKQMDFYAGCIARVSCYAHAYDTMGNMGVSFFLNNIQKVDDGTRISGRMNAEDEFPAVKKDEEVDEELEDLL